jgi:DNA-binding transcriptional ArsR family regulator
MTPDRGSAGAAEDVLAALADPTRRLLLDRLSAYGESTATTLAAGLPISRQAVVQHLSVLDAVGLVTGHRHGRERRYVVCPEKLTEAARWMDQVAAQWDARLAAIQRLAEDAPGDDAPRDDLS